MTSPRSFFRNLYPLVLVGIALGVLVGFLAPAAGLRVHRIALVVLTGSTKWSRVRQHADRIAAAVASATSGSYSELEIPFEPKRGRA